MLKNINRPTLLINKNIAYKNIERIKEKADELGLIFRPHLKTLHVEEIADWLRDFDIDKATVSSVEMAEYFVDNKWKDLTIAFPVNPLEIKEIKKLSKKINLNLLIESKDSLNLIGRKVKQGTGIFIKIDVGYNRTGIAYDNFRKIAELVQEIEKYKKLEFNGILTHAGHTYQTSNISEIRKIHFEQLQRMNNIKTSLGDQYSEIIVSIGDTPSCSIMTEFPGIDELRPGNFIFYDVMQAELGSCNYENIAACVACPVVAKHPVRNEITVYGGGVHLSKESIVNKNGKTIYGLPVYLNPDGWSNPISNSYVRSVSQEHGIIKLNDTAMTKIEVGDLIGILPVHSCLTMNLNKENYQIIK